ncbi:MAG: MGH1-like glycoside hydrolase domain-containing protein [Tepidisphaerales bacterium]
MTSSSDTIRTLQRELCRGWNTWDPRSVLSHVRLPDGACVRLGLKEYASPGELHEALVGRWGDDVEEVRLETRPWDARYTRLQLRWHGITVEVETSIDDDGFFALVSPVSLDSRHLRPPVLTVRGGLAFGREGLVGVSRQRILLRPADGPPVDVGTDPAPVPEPHLSGGPVLAVPLRGPVAVWAGKPRRVAEAVELLASRRPPAPASRADELRSLVAAAITWNTVYDPARDRAITPVSRLWSSQQGGWVLFCWDTFFAAILATLVDHRLAMANLFEGLAEVPELGFVPNTSNAHGFVTRDRSQPPVGSMALRDVYRATSDPSVIDAVFDRLLTWNRWWHAHRNPDPHVHLLAYGSNPYTPVVGNEWETPEKGVGGRFGGALESGLDNSPMYDDVPYDPATHCLGLHDVGLTSLYVRDCTDLAEMAGVIGRCAERQELLERATAYRRGLATLWDAERGLFSNRPVGRDTFHARHAPTCFYPLLTGVVTAGQARQMVEGHIEHPDRFGGELTLPSVPRDDPAFAEQHYWRGRIWPPLNYLTWRGLHESSRTHPELRDAASRLARRSADLALHHWRRHRHICENIDARTGDNAGYRWSDRFYHWGALLALPELLGGET